MKVLKILLLLALLALFAGCAGSEPPSAEPHLLRVVLWDYEVTRYDRQIIEAFERENPDITVEVISYRSERYTHSLETLLESGTRVDVIYANQMAMLTELAQNGWALPLDGLAARDGMDLSQFPFLDTLRGADGALTALPYRFDKFVLYYNKDLFDLAGLPYPEDGMTWDAFYQTAAQLQAVLDTAHENDRYSLFSIYMPTHWSELLTSAPFSVRNLNTTQLEQGLALLVRLQQEGILIPQSTSRAQRGVQRQFESGGYGMFICGTWLMHYLVTDTENGLCTMDWNIAGCPRWESEENVEAAWVTSLCIHPDSAEREAAWRFLRFVCGKEGARIMAQNLMLPACWDAEIEHLLEEQRMRYGLNLHFSAAMFAPPQPVLSIRESVLRTLVIEEIGKAILELETPQECIRQIQTILS